MKRLICPISFEKVDETVTRLTAFLTILIVITAFLIDSSLPLFYLAVDFYIRAFTKLKFSPMSYLSREAALLLKLRHKPVDKAPKIFAARMGFLMALLISIFFATNFITISIIISVLLLFFASLESIFGFCAGCYIYTYLILPLYK